MHVVQLEVKLHVVCDLFFITMTPLYASVEEICNTPAKEFATPATEVHCWSKGFIFCFKKLEFILMLAKKFF